MDTKVCSKCKKEKKLSEFHHCMQHKNGYKSSCKECSALEGKKYRKTYKEKEKERHWIYNINHKKEKASYEKEHKIEADARKRKYIETHPLERRAQARNYYHRHKDKCKEYALKNKDKINKYRREFYATHPQARLAKNMRTAIGRLVTGKSKGGRMLKYLGCDITFFRNHLESKWVVNMDWTNYGSGKDKWNVDHIRPLESFDLENEDDRLIALNWKNCRPLWQSQNCSKGSLYNGIRKHKK